MPREITIPESTVQEDIYLIEEAVGVAVRVLVGVLNSEGQFDLSTPTKEYRILHEMYTELNGPPTSWAPDKPNGTYRNDDLWHFIDILRNTDAE